MAILNEEITELREIYPRFFYRRIQVNKLLEQYLEHIDMGFGYFLRRIYIKYPQRVLDPALAVAGVWAAGAAVALNEVRYPSAVFQAANPNFLYFICTAAGLTGGAEPVWGRQSGAVVIDGGVTWAMFNPSTESVNNVVYARTSSLLVEILDNANDQLITFNPMIPDSVFSPGSNNSIIYDAFQAADTTGFSKNWSANPPYRSDDLNILFRFGDVICLRFSGITQYATLFVPNFIDIVLQGYYVPEHGIPVHGKGVKYAGSN